MNNLREAYQAVYSQLDERMSDDEKELRRLAAQERRAGNSDRMDSKVAAKYADSESKSAKKADEKSKGKHIHGMADSVELDGDLVDNNFESDSTSIEEVSAPFAGPRELAKIKARDKTDKTKTKSHLDYLPSKPYTAKTTKVTFKKATTESAVPGQPAERLGAVTAIPKDVRDAARERTLAKAKEMRDKKKIREDLTLEAKNKEGKEQGADGKACWKGYKYAGTKNGKDKCVKAGYEMEGGQELDERALDSAETQEKERLVKGMKKSAAGFKKRYGDRATSVMYATATKQAKRNMDTSQSDRRYSVEEANPEHRTRKPSQIAKQQKLTRLLDQIRSKKGENNN
jgi:hypothetical protein